MQKEGLLPGRRGRERRPLGPGAKSTFPPGLRKRKFSTASILLFGSAGRGATVASSGQSDELGQGNTADRQGEQAVLQNTLAGGISLPQFYLKTAGIVHKFRPPHMKPPAPHSDTLAFPHMLLERPQKNSQSWKLRSRCQSLRQATHTAVLIFKEMKFINKTLDSSWKSWGCWGTS